MEKEQSRHGTGYELNDIPPIAQLIPLSIQHVLMFIAATLAVPLLIASALGMDQADTSLLVQSGIFVAGIGTIIQSLGVGPVGGRLPIVLGATFIFLGPGIAIGQEYGYAAVMGSCLIGGIVTAVLGAFVINWIRKIFPPLVMGVVIMTIGLGLLSAGVNYCAGGEGSPTYGAPRNLILAAVTMVIIILLNVYAKGFTKGASVLIGVIIGTIIAIPLGMIDFSSLSSSSWFAFPEPLHFGMRFELVPTIICLFLYVVSAVEFIGDCTNATNICVGEDPTPRQLSGGIICDGLTSSIASLFSTIPVISYSGNIGLMRLTGVKSRFIVAVCGVMLTILGFFPKIATLLSLVPTPVIGGACIITFGIIASTGMDILMRLNMNERDKLIVAVSLSIGLGFNYTPAALAGFPFYVGAMIKGVPGAAFSAAILNAILPKNERADQED